MAETATAPRLMSSIHEPEAAVAGRIRRRVRGLLESWGVGDASADDVLLVVEELVANVLDHARTRFEIAVRLSGSVVHIAVRDHSGRSPRIRPVDPQAARGRGLQLVAGLSERWGCVHHPDGKTVWAELSVGGC
jgi:anti-sigma regulatory factor (Ser/Thr protein kinase)